MRLDGILMMKKLAIAIFIVLVFVFSYILLHTIGPESLSDFNPDNLFSYMNYSVLYGTVFNSTESPISGALISLISDSENFTSVTDYLGKFNISGITPGVYTILVEKEGYRQVRIPAFMFIEGHYYPWNLTLNKDCLYFPINVSSNYVVRYGFNGTVYKGNVTYVLAYPEGAEYTLYPSPDSKISFLETFYQAGNRMIRWKIDNLHGRYSYVPNYVYVDLKGSGVLRLFENSGMQISESAAAQPNYLAPETAEDGRRMIDPNNSDIKEIAERIKSESGSNDSWTVAEALFVWLKNNTEYYHGSDSDTYTQSASEILSSRKGDCDELSFLYVSLCRSVGIPARFVEGYMVDHEPKQYIGHVWVEFYDGEWIPVEVAGSGNINITWELANRFGIGFPDHVSIFIDDGTNASVSKKGYRSNYYDSPPIVNSYIYYDISESDSKYIMACVDGTRSLVDEK